MRFTYEFDYQFSHKDHPILLKVKFEFYKGKTRAMGDDPDNVEILSAFDRTDYDVWDRLPTKTRQDIIDRAYDMGNERHAASCTGWLCDRLF